MFDQLSDKILASFKKLKGKSRITPENIQEVLKEIRLSLLEADVNFKVVKQFIDRVQQKALGTEVLNSVLPAQQFVKIVHDELVLILGGENPGLTIKGSPSVILLVGLQGSGKTTTAAKLALYARQKLKKKALLVPADVYRPAAIEQLKTLAKQNEFACFDSRADMKPETIVKEALHRAAFEHLDLLIVDSAGRTQLDEEMMSEIKNISNLIHPQETLLVADAMLGQQSVNVAKGFHDRLSLTGLILTKVDGDARGGAALSIKETIGIPIKFIGTGEKVGGLEVFHPDRLASRILDMGDVVTLVEKAQEVIDEDLARESARKMMRSQFTVEDFLQQLRQMKKLGGMESILKMLPGMGQMMKQIKDLAPPDQEVKKIEAIICSMTKKERANHKVLNGSRRQRIALGSGTQVSDVNRFIKQFEQSQKMMSQMMKMGFGRKGMGGGFRF